MNKLTIIPIFTLAILAITLVSGNAEAASTASKGSCSHITIMGVGNNFRSFVAYSNEEIPGVVTGCTTSGDKNPVLVNSGNSITINCLETTSGVIPPGAPDVNGIIIRGYHDNEGFPDGAGQKWTTTFTSCLTEQTFTRYCTSDGTSTGTPVWGPMRIYIRVVRTVLGSSYDDASDSADGANDGNYGVFLCNPSISSNAVQLGGTGAAIPQPVQGGDVIFSNWTLGSLGMDATNTISSRIKCSPGTGSQSNQPVNSNPRSLSATIQTPQYEHGCTIIQNISITRNVAVTGWTTTPYATWTSAPAGVTIQNSSRDAESSTTRTVSYLGSFTSILNSKSSAGPNASNFVISVDNEFVTAKGLRDPRGNLVAGATVICQRTRTDGILEASVTMGNTNAGGDSPEQSFAALPPQGTWTTGCRSTFNGNSAFYNITYFHSTTLSANTGLSISVNVTANGTDRWNVNVTLVIRQYDPITNTILRAFPDAAPQLTVLGFNRTLEAFDDIIVNRANMTVLDGVTSEYYHNFTATTTNLTPAAIYAAFNLTGLNYLGSQGYYLTTSSSGSGTVTMPLEVSIPLSIFAVWLGIIAVSFITRNPIATILCVGILVAFGFIILQQRAYIPHAEKILVVFGISLLALSYRGFLLFKPEGVKTE